MSQLSVNHVTYAYVPSDMNRQATTMLNPASATYLAEGEIALADLQGNFVTNDPSTYTGVDKMQIVFRKDSGIFRSPPININNIKSYKVTPFSAATNKVVYLGYNGTAFDLEGGSFIGGTEYMIDVRKLGIMSHYEDNIGFHKNFGYYCTSSTATQAVVAKGIVKNGVSNFSDKYGIDNFILIEMVSNASDSAAGTAVDFIYGSKVAVAAGTGHTIAAGDYIRPAGADTTNAVYYVESVNGTNIYLEVPFQGTSGSVTPHILTTPLTADYGIKITGTTKKFDSGNNKFRYDVPDFQLTLRNFSATEETVSQTANVGNGTWKEVAQLEWETQDYNGQTSHTDHLMPTRKRYFEEGNAYDILVLSTFDNDTDSLAGTPKSPFTLIVPIATACDQGNNTGVDPVAMGLVTALDIWMTTNLPGTYDEDSNLT